MLNMNNELIINRYPILVQCIKSADFMKLNPIPLVNKSLFDTFRHLYDYFENIFSQFFEGYGLKISKYEDINIKWFDICIWFPLSNRTLDEQSSFILSQINYSICKFIYDCNKFDFYPSVQVEGSNILISFRHDDYIKQYVENILFNSDQIEDCLEDSIPI